MASVTVTKAEQRAIKSLERLAAKWPKSLQLFSWSSNLTVFKKCSDGRWAPIPASLSRIPNDGGDPDSETVNQDVDVKYESTPNG